MADLARLTFSQKHACPAADGLNDVSGPTIVRRVMKIFDRALRRFRPASLALLFTLAYAASAQATYPDHPVRIVVPFAAGGVADSTSRIVADKLSEKLAEQVNTLRECLYSEGKEVRA